MLLDVHVLVATVFNTITIKAEDHIGRKYQFYYVTILSFKWTHLHVFVSPIDAGQFWNVPVLVKMNPNNLESGGFFLPTYNVTIPSGSTTTHSFTAYLFDTTWDAVETPCLYAGDGQAGPDVLEGSYLDYQVLDMFDTDFKFSRFWAGYC